jgi:hypothetical protein
MSGSSLITINSSNASGTQTNLFNYNFPSGSVNFRNAKIAVQSIIIPYSWLNINDTFYNNASFNIIIPVKISGVTTTRTLNLTIPNGFYTLQNINQYLQAQLVNAGYYLINASSQNVYYIEFTVNNQLNNVQLNSYVVPTTLPGSWSYGATATWGAAGIGSLPSTANLVPQLQTLANNFGSLIGFASSTTFPASNVSAVTVSTASSFVPQITPVQSLYCGVSLVRNKLANPTNIIANIPLTSAYATNIIYTPQELIWLPVLNGNFASFQVIFYDQLYNALPIIDTNLTVTLLLEYDVSGDNKN